MSKAPLLSFHGSQEIKDKYLKRLELHMKADEIIQGTGWENGKGCAVGCTLNAYDHKRYETELGIPRILAMLEDRIFERIPNVEAKSFPYEFLTSIPVGVDLTPVWKKFLVWLLIDDKEGAIQYAKKEETKSAIKNVADLIHRSLTEEISEADFLDARKKAAAAAAAADDAAADDADADAAAADADADADAYAAAADAAAAYAAAAAADDAAAAAADADADAAAADADADAYAAAAAYAYAAYAAAAYAAYAADARVNKYRAMRGKLIELLKAA